MVNNDNTEGVCKGIRVKYACGEFAVGFVLQHVLLLQVYQKTNYKMMNLL